jgi:hypothetical protein
MYLYMTYGDITRTKLDLYKLVVTCTRYECHGDNTPTKIRFVEVLSLATEVKCITVTSENYTDLSFYQCPSI